MKRSRFIRWDEDTKDRKDVIIFDNKIIVIILFRAIGWRLTKNGNGWDRVVILLPNWDEERVVSKQWFDNIRYKIRC